jgi:hypothetical protein
MLAGGHGELPVVAFVVWFVRYAARSAARTRTLRPPTTVMGSEVRMSRRAALILIDSDRATSRALMS